MIGFRTLVGTLFAAALISAASGVEPRQQDMPGQIDASSGGTHTVVCPPGKVMTGIGVFEDIVAEGTDQSEIRGVEIRCDEPVNEPS